MVEKTFFGILPDGREVHQSVLKTSTGSSVTIIDNGAIVTTIMVPVKNGRLENVVLNGNMYQRKEPSALLF